MGNTHSIDDRDKGYGWLNGDTHMDGREKGYLPFPLSYTGVTSIQPAVPFSLSSMFCVCEEKGVYLSLYHALMRSPFSQPHPILGHQCLFFCVWPHSTRGEIWLVQWAPHTAWIEETRDTAGWMVTHSHGWQRDGLCTLLSVMHVCDTYSASHALNSVTHVVCVTPIQPEEGYSWLYGHHTQYGWTRQWVRLMNGDTNIWMTKSRVHTLLSVIHPCEPFSQLFPSLCHPYFVCVCVCVWLSFNQRRSTTGWMGATHNMDDRGKWYVPMFLSWTYATPFSQPLPFLWSMFFVCDHQSTVWGRGLWLVEWVPYTTWIGETRGMDSNWDWKYMNDKGKCTYPFLSYTCANQPPVPFCQPCFVYVWGRHSNREEFDCWMGATHNMDRRDKGYGWWMGVLTCRWQREGYIPFSLAYTCATLNQPTVPFCLSPCCVCALHLNRRGVWLVEWAPHTS